MRSDGAAEGRARFTPEEARATLAAFALPALRRVREYKRGSARAPKALVECVDGTRYLLKRRESGHGRSRVVLCHAVHEELSRRRFPVARLVPLARSGRTALEQDGFVYELFEFIEGEAFDRSRGATHEAGTVLARMHSTLQGWLPEGARPATLFHGSALVERAWAALPAALGGEGAMQEDVGPTVDALASRWRRVSAAAAGAVSLPGELPACHVLHGDFHPGNVLFRAGFLSAVLDLDSVRAGHRILDIANAAMQFALDPIEGSDESAWPAALDMGRLEAFLRGYARHGPLRLAPPECAALAPLMVEASIAESVPRIAGTGRFGRLPGAPFLRHVERKTASILERTDDITTLSVRCMSGD